MPVSRSFGGSRDCDPASPLPDGQGEVASFHAVGPMSLFSDECMATSLGP
ncbi:MAG: hypothetical protein KF861_08860 [Planctomycetaceae bacterium]|nr:hypothetical protein [Planctomycetaceae bacterium]